MSVTLSITVSDANAQRIAVAFGRQTMQGAPPVIVQSNATVADVQQQITNWIKQRVLDYEASVAANIQSQQAVW